MSKQADIKKALAKAAAFLGKEIELPPETNDDLMREAQAVINYFNSKGEGFKDKPCKKCGEIFSYCWNVDGISYCSISCAKRALQDIGLDWNPSKPVSQRWGPTVPAVVPASALSVLQTVLNNLDIRESHPNSTPL